MQPLAARALAMPPQGVRVIMDLANQVPDCIRLEVGQPDFPTPPHIVAAAVAAAQDPRWHAYTPNAGIPSLREAIAAKMRAAGAAQVTADWVCVHPGAVAGLASALTALCDPGDQVLVPGLCWPNGALWLQVLGAEPVFYPLHQENGFLPDPDELRRLITPRTKALLTCSPGNPTGAVFPPALVQALYDLCAQHDLWLISDEIYEHIVFSGPHTSPATLDRDGRVIVVSGFSKGYAMCGWRVGYTVSPPPVAQTIIKLQEPLTSCVNAVAQKAAEAALTGPQDCVAAMREAYRQRRDLALAIVREHGLFRYEPQGAFYLLVDVSAAGLDSYAIAKALLAEEQVAVAPGEAFGTGGRGLVRVSLAAAGDAIAEGLRRIARFLRRHGG